MVQGNNSDFLIGFGLGFFLGCFGLVVAAFLKPEYLQGAAAGMVFGFVLSCGGGLLVGLSAPMLAVDGSLESSPPELESLSPQGPSQVEVPWGLVCSVMAGCTIAASGVAGALWMARSETEPPDDEGPVRYES